MQNDLVSHTILTCTVLQSIRHVLINDTVVRGEQPALYWSRGEGAQLWAAWAEEEAIQKELQEREAAKSESKL